jgi:opacity protein-like surface antigen
MSRALARGVTGGALALCAFLGAAGNAAGQTAPAAADDGIAFDRPEAWAMKYFTSATALTGLTTPDRPTPGSFSIQFESGWLPRLSAAQEHVGFNGSAQEDLNQAPVVMRPRVTVGLGRGLAITAAVDPPIRTFGVTPRLLALGLDGVIHDSGAWRTGWRAHGQIGSVTAAVTCPASVLSFAPGSASNRAGCTAESSDVTSLRYGGVEFQVERRISRRFAPHAAIGANVVDTVFQTDAQTFGKPDRTRLRASGVTLTSSAGVGYAVTERIALAADLFYAPLTVRRPGDSRSSIDPMFNARALVSYRVIR